jgi:hypothetical protein
MHDSLPRTPYKRGGAVKAMIGATVAAATLVGSAPAAHARTAFVKTPVNGLHLIAATGDVNRDLDKNGPVPAGLESWRGLQSWESAPFWDTVCNTAAAMGEIHPQHGLVMVEVKGPNPNCALLLRKYHWEGWTSYYTRGTGMWAKWKSDNTVGGNWQTIGVMYH